MEDLQYVIHLSKVSALKPFMHVLGFSVDASTTYTVTNGIVDSTNFIDGLQARGSDETLFIFHDLLSRIEIKYPN